MKQFNSVLISDFNLGNLAGFLNADEEKPVVETQVAPYGQVAQMLMDANHEIWQNKPDFAVVWTRPEGVIAAFNDVLNYRRVPIEALLAEVDHFTAQLTRILDRVSFVFVPTWVVPPHYSTGMLDMRNEIGIANALMRMNLRLAENLQAYSNVYILNAQRWVEVVGKNAFQTKPWYMAKIPFGNDVFKEAVKDVKAALRGLAGKAKKLIILDLDDTLWEGIVGDVGWENLRLGGHDMIGEAMVDFQRALKAMTQRGIVLGIVSKNTEEVALTAIQSHPEMVLKLEDFAGWRINWQEKARNVAELVESLNLGIDSVVFIDDNPVERARVREALPDVYVPEWPEDKTQYKKALLSLNVFETPAISAEDAERTKMYVVERQREALKTEVGSFDEWLATLGLRVEASPITPSNVQRVVQLFNKTNQMNLSTRRMTEAELVDWANDDNRRFWAFSVSDKFGDAGLTGLASVEVDGDTARIVDYILSCRVMGRKVEETMLAAAVDFARALGARTVIADYLPTAKNKPCLEFFRRSGFAYDEAANRFSWDTNDEYPFPTQIAYEAAFEQPTLTSNSAD